MILTDAHFSHNTPRNSVLDLPLALLPLSLKTWSAPPNRRASAILEKTTKITLVDRLLWVWLSRIWSDWRSALAIVEPETVAWAGICAYRELRPYHPASSWHARSSRCTFLVGKHIGV
jgi:hypothetical protein